VQIAKALAFTVTLLVTFDTSTVGQCAEPIDIGSRLELFVDNQLIEKVTGDVQQVVQNPQPREVVLVHDEPWGGNICAYFTVLQDDDTYRMVYRSAQHDKANPKKGWGIAVYVESKDGIHWTKPNLGMFSFRGNKENNILDLGSGGNVHHNFTIFRDDNPATPDEERYKGVGGLAHGLIGFTSPDCIHWKRVQAEPIIKNGRFDSQNIVFWDADRKEYRAYWRVYPNKIRAIRTATSQDFIHWEEGQELTYTDDSPPVELYTNAIQKYFRAPHLFLGFPTRFYEESEQVEPLFMASRDGVEFRRYTSPVIPRTAPKDRDLNRSNYMVWGMVQLPGKPDEISVYGTENYYQKTPGRVRRFVYRVDGFVALHGGEEGGQVVTKPLRYTGKELLLNSVVPQDGSLKIEVLDEHGKVLGTSQPIVGDAIDRAVTWDRDPELSAGIVQLRFTMKNADVYSFRFK
tara:strand:- start:343 stop:1719 length:1377 start_codon:yes stop_codon:yes gene_type:complete